MDMMTITMDTVNMTTIMVDTGDMMIIMEVTMNILLEVTRITLAMLIVEGLMAHLVVMAGLHEFLYIMEIALTMTILDTQDRIPKCIPVLTQYFLTRRNQVTRILSILVTKVNIMKTFQYNNIISLNRTNIWIWEK